MKEPTHDETTATRSTRAGRTGDAARRRLFVMRTGATLFAVYADEVEATSENATPTPLPFAPAPVRGVVSQRGRILTLIDPLPLLRAANPAGAPPPVTEAFAPHATRKPAPFVVALRGDEQLALSVESIERDIELYDEREDQLHDEREDELHDEHTGELSDERAGELFGEEPRNASDAPANPLIRRTIRHESQAVALLDPAFLFDAAMQGVDRRRRRT